MAFIIKRVLWGADYTLKVTTFLDFSLDFLLMQMRGYLAVIMHENKYSF